jgi:pimeloyl-ACP methyl ester carboxylesterase
MATKPAEQAVQEKVISADGTPIAYWRSGQGRPLVLVHGTTADHTRWATVLDLFQPHATVCAIDRRGRGGSGDAEHYAIEREAEDVAAVVDALAAETGGAVDLFGHSHGAICSLEAALLTENLRALVLYEPPVVYDPDTYPEGLVERLDDLLTEGRREDVVATFFREMVGMTEDQLASFRRLPAWPARVAAAHTLPREERVGLEYARDFEADRFGSIIVPTLMLLGSDSPSFLRRSTEAVAAALPNADITVLEGQQHVAMDTAPQLLAGLVLAFLAKV